MTIRRGEDWGRLEPIPSDAVPASGDHAAALILGAALDAGESPPPVVLGGGDLARSLGHTPTSRSDATGEAPAFTIDVMAVDLPSGRHYAIAHVVVGTMTWLRHSIVFMNGTHRGGLNLGPRAHPNDGLVDVTAGRLRAGDALKARQRMGAGTHLPHPDLTTARVDSATHQLDTPSRVTIDGWNAGKFTDISVTVLPDVATIFLS